MTYPLQAIPSFSDPGAVSIHIGSTITASGSQIFTGYGSKEVSVIINTTATPTGTTPTLQFTLQEVDPGDQTTVFGVAVSTSSINAIGVFTATLRATVGGAIKVSWSVSGSSPSFTGVYSTLTSKVGTPTAADGSVIVTLNNATTQTVAQGTASSLSGGWPVKVTDGTNTLPTGDAVGRAIFEKITDGTNTAAVTASSALKVDGSAVTQPVSGSVTATVASTTVTNTVAVSAASLPLPAGASTAAKQPALGTAGSASSDVISVQGVASMTALKVDGSAVTQPVSATALPLPTGAATATNQTTLGNQTTKINDGTNTAAVKAASTAAVATDPAIVVALSPNFGITGNLPISFGDPGTSDTFGHLIVASRIAQIVVPFFQNTPANLVAVTTTGTGTTSQGAGTGIFSTGASAGGEAKGVSFNTVSYAAHYELYAAMTASFTTGVASTTQRMGIFNATDGFSFGYNGTGFGLWTRFNTTDTFVAKGSWNVDQLTGAAGSKFTLGGAPVALDPTKINLYRIRYGWLGIANVAFEVLAPDGNFVVVHVAKFTNTQTSVSITNPNLPLTVDVNNLAVATSLTVTCGCWVAGSTGPGGSPILNGLGTIAANGASVIFPVVGTSALSFAISGTWSGTLTFQYSLDGITWTNDVVLSNTLGTFVSSTTTNQAFETGTSAYKLYRINSTAWSSGTATVTYNGGTGSGVITALSKITDASNNGPVAVKPASTAATATDPALVVAISPNNPISVSGTADATAAGALGALNAAVQVTTAGLSSVGFQLASGTLIGTIVPETSLDGGTTWNSTYFSDPSTGVKSSSIVFSIANTATVRSIVGVSGSGITRIRVSAYTSGSANITLRASMVESSGSYSGRFTTSGSGYSTLTSPNALTAGLYGQVTAYGTLKVSTEGSELFVEPFDGVTVDITNRWNQTIVGGATISQANGSLTMAVGTTASNAAALSSQNLFRAIGLGFQIFGVSLQVEASALTNNHRFWGLGTQPGSWTAVTPIQDGAGFEQDITGALNAVTYSGGTRTIAAVLTRPSDGLNHRYAMYVRADLIFWFVDTLEVPVASANWPPLGQQTLPIRFHSINHTSVPTSAPTFVALGAGMNETSHSGVQISDGTYAWRKSTVKPASTAAVAADPALVVAISPNNTIIVNDLSSTTTNVTSVASSATSVQLLASNTARIGATLYNDSTAILFVKLGTTASATSFTVKLLANGYYELPYHYNGRIDGIWASATGNCRITELS